MGSEAGSVALAGDVQRVWPPGLVWDQSAAVLGALYALPGAVVILSDRSRGLALAVGVLPAAIAGLMPTRRGRLAIVVLGTSIGVPMFIGGLLANVPVLAVLAIAGLGVVSALLAARSRLGQIAMTLSLPMVGIGLSYPNLGKAAAVAGLMVLGSLFACLVAMLWPEHAAAAPSGAGPKPTLGYGVRLGAAGATAAAIGIVRLGPPAWVYSLAALAAVAGAAATLQSRWYVTPAFTTFLVFLLLLYSRPQDAASRLKERIVETLLGVGIAYAFGLGLPAMARELRRRPGVTPA
jgi:hypothetical protein